MMKKHIYLDIHGVVADFARHVLVWYALPGEYGDIRRWNWLIEKYIQEYPGKKVHDFWEGLTEEFWVTVPSTPVAHVLLSIVTTYCRDFTLLTSPSFNSAGPMQAWIQKNMPEQFYAGNYIITPRKDRVAAPGRLLIDDRDDNCAAWEQAGGKAILVPRPWNVNRGLPVIETVHKGLELFYAN